MIRIPYKKLATFIYILSFSVCSLHAITIYNKTDAPLFVAPYYVNDEASRVGAIVALEPGQSIEIERPARKLLYDRELAFTQHEDGLPDIFTTTDFKQLPSKNIGDIQGSTFYIAQDGAVLKGYNSAEWNIIYPIGYKTLEKIDQFKRGIAVATTLTETKLLELKYALGEQIKANFTTAQQNPHKDHVAYVRIGNELSEQEREYVKERTPVVKRSIERLLNTALPDSYVPTIALICSGGGYRAALATVGGLSGLHEIGLLDALMYVISLSGSTWAIGPWYSSGLSISAFRTYIIDTIVGNKGLANIGPQRAGLIGQAILTRFVFDQPITLIDFYGGLIANALLHYAGNARQRIYLSEQSKNIADGMMPLPIYTAIRADVYPETEWYEMTPFEVGSPWLGMYIPTWAFGRLFIDGVSIDNAPEVSLGFVLGTCGSAFAVTFNRLYQEIAHSIPSLTTKLIIEELLKVVGEKRLFSAQTFNFSYGTVQSPIKDQRIIKLADAGIDFNLPYPPVSGQRPERAADILIIIDVAAGIAGEELYKCELYARKHNLKFPHIDRTMVTKKAVSIFKDEHDPTVPLVIYLPYIKDVGLWDAYKARVGKYDYYVQQLETFDPAFCTGSDYCDLRLWESYKHKLESQGRDVRDLQTPNQAFCKVHSYCSSFNFSYTKSEAEKLVLQMEFNIKENRETIVEAIDWKMKQRTRIAKL